MRTTVWRLLVTAIGLGALASIMGVWNPSRVEAFNPQPEPPGHSMIGITQDQTARLNVLATEASVCGTEPSPFTFDVEFRDSGNIRLAMERLVLRPGEAAFLDLNGDDLGLGRHDRMQIRAVVTAADAPGRDPGVFCGLVSVEVFDNGTLETLFIYSGHP